MAYSCVLSPLQYAQSTMIPTLDLGPYLAGSTVMFLSFLTVVGTLCSDLLLMFIDPRIRHE